MGLMPGHRQVTMYIKPSVYEQAAHVAKMLGEPVYVFLNDALEAAIKVRTTPEQRRAIEVLTGSSGAKKPVREKLALPGSRSKRKVK
jgi:hypothetical protein